MFWQNFKGIDFEKLSSFCESDDSGGIVLTESLNFLGTYPHEALHIIYM